MNNIKLESAMHYASVGWSSFPLNYIRQNGVCSCGGIEVNPKCKPGKHPYAKLVPNGHINATTNTATVHAWFSGIPYNIGIATGAVSGFWLLDVDGEEGAVALAALEAEHGQLPDTLRVRTGSGGMHYYFTMPTGVDIRNSEKLVGDHIDVRGSGGYVVAPPSNHISGNQYVWVGCVQPSLGMIADAPQWLIAAATSKKVKEPIGHIPLSQALCPTFLVPDKVTDGRGRESTILRYAGHLRGTGVDQATIEQIVLDFNKLHIAPPLDDAVVLDRARRYDKSIAISANDPGWPEPEEICAALPPVPPFNIDLLPPEIRDWVGDIAERMQCPIEFLAVGAMVAAGAVVGNRIGVQPKQLDTGWLEVPNLWGAVVGRPGVMKSPALAQVLSPLKNLEATALAGFEMERAKFKIARMQYDAAMKHLAGNATKGNQIATDQLPVEPEEPQPPRLLLMDATYQKLGLVLSGNPHGVMTFQDELSGLMVRLDSDGQEAAKAFYLESWNGLQPYTFDRIERGTIRIPRLCLSVFGGLQPSKLRQYLRSAVYGGKGDDGFSQRLQLLVYPDISTDWKRVDRSPNMDAAAAADRVFGRLSKLNPEALGAHMPVGDGIPLLRFSGESQHLFNLWWELLEKEIRHGERHPALESHMSKYRKLVPAMALLDHLILGRHGDIQIDSLKRAIGWQRFLLEHAKRAYAAVTLAVMDSAKALSDRLLRGVLKDGFTVRDVYRHNWSMLTTPKEAAEAVTVLADLGWLRAIPDTKLTNADGRPTVRFYINPRVKAAA